MPVKPTIIYTLPDAIKQVDDLQKKLLTLEGMLAQERLVYGRVTYELTIKNQALQEEITQVNHELLQAQQILADKDSLIVSLRDELARSWMPLFSSKPLSSRRQKFRPAGIKSVVFLRR